MKDNIPLKILCVLNKTANLSFYRNILKIQGHQIISVNDATSGYNIFKKYYGKETPFNFVLISYHLQDMNGIQLAITLKKIDPHALIMIIPSNQSYETEKDVTGFLMESSIQESSVWKIMESTLKRKTGRQSPGHSTNNIVLQYSYNCFARQIKKARTYCGYKTQNSLAEKMDVSRQVFSLWEKGKRNPGYTQLTLLSNILQICPCYFFIPEAIPEDYNIPHHYFRAKIKG